MARSTSGKGSRKNSTEQPEDVDSQNFPYNPSADNPNSDVSIVGQGYSKTTPRDSDPVELWRPESPPIPTHRNQNAREKKRQQRPSGKGVMLEVTVVVGQDSVILGCQILLEKKPT